MTSEWSVTARWVFPVDRPPIPNGVLVIRGDKIEAVEARGDRTADLDLGNVAILPGLVNAHTHLDLGALRGKLPPPDDFTQWLRALVNYRRSSAVEEWKESIRAGIEESLLAGTTLVGDISVGGHSLTLLAQSPLRHVVFYELIGLTRERARQCWHNAQRWLKEAPAGAELARGLSPHSPYSVRASLFRCAARSRRPQAIHFAETGLEEALLEKRAGPLRKFLEELGVWEGAGLASSLEWIARLQRRDSRVLFIHANYVEGTILEALRGRTVVYCPRTCEYFGHLLHPFCKLLLAGVNVALGTDSLASNPDLSVLEDMRWVWRSHTWPISGKTLLQMGTRNGAVALSIDAGSLAAGKQADWLALPLPDEETEDPHQLLFESELPVRDVVIAGQWAVRAGKRVQPLPS